MLKEHLASNGFLWGPEHNPYGVSGFMNYGPMGKRLKLNIESQFRTVFQDEGFDEIETPILYPTRAWEASGHLEKFGGEMFHTQTPSGQQLTGRSEIATTIYPLFRKLLEYYQGNLPFKIYQTGIVLPNDRQTEWQTRTRQYTGHEGHVFFETKQADIGMTIDYLQHLSFQLMTRAGIRSDSLVSREKNGDDKPFYATKAYGLYVSSDSDQELELLGIQYRSSRDFERHSDATGAPLKTKNGYPEVFEISFSSDRPFLTTLKQSFKETDGRVTLQLPEYLAPIPAMIFPLSNEGGVQNNAAEINDLLSKQGINIPVLSSGSIGQRYRRADGVGVPYVLTFDQQGVSDGTFTVRDRDTQRQARVNRGDVVNVLLETKQDSSQLGFARKLYQRGIVKQA